MKRGQTVSYQMLNTALYQVQDELASLGLWYTDSKLTQTEVYYCSLPQIWAPMASGFFVEENSWLGDLAGFFPGNIYIPSWVLLLGPFQNRQSLRDLVRHEYGHALLWHFEEAGESKEFIKAFGGSYSSDSGSPMYADCYPSRYATTNPAEDFAETFMCHVRNPSKRLTGPKKLRVKYKYVKWLIEKCGG